MKIYFTASLTGKKYYEENYKKIVSYLKEFGHKVIAEHILHGSKEKVLKETREEKLVYLKWLNKRIKKCDVMIAEVSYPSTSVGYEISLAMEKGKPVIAMYSEKGGDCPLVIKGLGETTKEEELMLLRYNFKNLKEVLKENIDFIKARSLNKRFTMLLSPKIVGYLDKIFKNEKIPRSVYIRKLIEEDMEKRGQKR